MSLVGQLGEFFLLSLGLGVGGFSFLANTKETGAGLLRLVSAIGGVATFIGSLLHVFNASPTDNQAILYYISTISFLLIYLFHKDEKGPFMWGLFFIHTIALTTLLFLSHNALGFFFTFTSIMLLGSITYAMVMGHWYLVTPKLSEAPLKWAIYFCWLALALKIGLTVFGWPKAEEYFVQGTQLGGGYSFNWMIFLMRVLWGYGVIGVMSYFAWRLISMRSIQSATGMLYAMTFFVFVGELISNYLFFEFGLYL
jgi:hypothetical protein